MKYYWFFFISSVKKITQKIIYKYTFSKQNIQLFFRHQKIYLRRIYSPTKINGEKKKSILISF